MTEQISAEIIGRKVHRGVDRHTVFLVAVSGPDDTFVIQRRYSDFANVRQSLQHCMPSLPEMPPKSTFRRLLRPSFMNERQVQLGRVLAAMIEMDPNLSNQNLRALLGFVPLSCLFIGHKTKKGPSWDELWASGMKVGWCGICDSGSIVISDDSACDNDGIAQDAPNRNEHSTTCPIKCVTLPRRPTCTELRRQTLTLTDVAMDRQSHDGPLRKRHIAISMAFAWAYGSYLLPAFQYFGTSRWYSEEADSKDVQTSAGGPWAHVSWALVSLVTLTYLFVVFASVRMMAHRPPLESHIFEYMLTYNITQVALNSTLAFKLCHEAWRLGFSMPWGNTLDFTEVGHHLGSLLWLQYHCRQLDLFDTIFLILRKRFHRMSSLHIFLRLAHMWSWFLVCCFACGGDSYFPAAVNAGCQAVVYLYYILSLIDPEYVRFSCKDLVSQVQISQFVVCLCHSGYVLYLGSYPRSLASLNLFIIVVGLVFFMDFDGDQPRFGRRSGIERNDPFLETMHGRTVSCEVQQEQKDRLTFCFDSCGWLYLYHFGVAQWIQDHMLPEDLNPTNAVSNLYPEGLAFSGSSGGSLVAGALAMGIKVQDVVEPLLAMQPTLMYRPWLMLKAVEDMLRMMLPENAAASMSGRVRILLSRISGKPPFLTGEVVDQFDNKDEVFHTLRASCHVPGLRVFPYSFRQRLYFDGLMWSSLLVPWCGADDSHIVKVSATSLPLGDIRAPLHPLWWAIFPPSVETLRGMYWVGYRDAAAWMSTTPSQPIDLCSCHRVPSSASVKDGEDPLTKSHRAKHLTAQKFLLRGKDMSCILPTHDPKTGQVVADLILCYRVSILWSYIVAVMMLIAIVAVVAHMFSTYAYRFDVFSALKEV